MNQFVILPPEKASFSPDPSSMAISPDGRQIVFAASGSARASSLWVRPLDSLSAHELAGTDDGTEPFWSPDSRSIGFFARGKLQRIDVAGGPAQALADASFPVGGAWGRGGVIVFAPRLGPLYRVLAAGGAATLATYSGERVVDGWPSFLPDGRHFLFFGASLRAGASNVYVGSLDSRETKTIIHVNMFIDTSNASGTIVPPVDFTTGQVMTPTTWEQHMAGFTVAMRQAFPTAQIIHNLQWFAGTLPAGTDPLVQQEILAADYINLERGINDPNLVTGTGSYGMNAKLNFVDVVHSLNRKVIIEEWTFDGDLGRAGYFLISTGMDGFGNTEVTPTDWYPGYDVVLGTPLGIRYDWYGLLRRDFSGGISLLNPFNGPTITLPLPSTYTNTSGTQVTSVTLTGGTGAVLVGPAPSTAPVTIQSTREGPRWELSWPMGMSRRGAYPPAPRP